MISMYLYAFIILCIVAGSVVAFYYLGESVNQLDKIPESRSKLKVCPPGCQKGSKEERCMNCVPYEEAIDLSGEESVLEEEMEIMPTPEVRPTPEIRYDERREFERNQRIKEMEEVKSENDYIRKLNERIDEINKEIKN